MSLNTGFSLYLLTPLQRLMTWQPMCYFVGIFVKQDDLECNF